MATSPLPDPDAVAGTSIKRRRLTQHQVNFNVQEEVLIPGLPDHIAQICLSSVHPSVLYSVSRSWRSLISSPSFQPYLSLYALLSPAESNGDVKRLSMEDTGKKSVEFFSFDPIMCKWTQLPPRPRAIRFTVQHRSFLSLNLPIQSVSVAGKLVVVAATDPVMLPALDSPLIFDPAQRSWTYGPEMAHPRRWCAAGSANESVYVASGVGSQFKTSVARSVERWRFGGESERKRKRRWEKMRTMKDARLSREAVEAVGCRGKLYMVNVKGNAAKEGFVYNTVRDEWEEMKVGMLGGWRGPAAAMDEEEIFMVDERRGVLMRYEWERDAWSEVVESDKLKGAEQMAAAGGRVCVVGGGGGIVVVNVVCGTPSVWVVETPSGLRANTVHVLPRMMSG
ncbi:unnamed protein product [Rhodiola kirilowii]